MQNHKSLLDRKAAAGFTLPVILVVVSALLILAVGVLLLIGIERNTARSFVDRQRAELAAKSGLEDVRGIFTQEAANDDFLVIQSTLAAPIVPGKEPAPGLFLARGEAKGSTLSFNYTPLFSTQTGKSVLPTSALELAKIEPLVGTTAGGYVDFETLPYQDKARAAWLPVFDSKNEMVARYAYSVEDLQSRVDATIAGNKNGTTDSHARSGWPFPAPGLNDKPEATDQQSLNQIALYAIDPAATDSDQRSLGKMLIDNRKMLISPDSTLASAEIQPPLARLSIAQTQGDIAGIGELADPQARAVEEGLSAAVRPYEEMAVVPFASGIDPSASGKPKLNLNKMLATGGSAAIDQMADFIRKALPDFEGSAAKAGRKGGFPDDYIKTLAANALDYADSDSEPNFLSLSYRGLDAYPLVSEFLLKVRWENIRTANGRKYLDLSVSTYVELWNMTNQPVRGTAEVSYETKYSFAIPPNPNLYYLNDLSKATANNLTQKDGYSWYPSFEVDLKPDEYRVYKCGTVNFSYDAVSASEFISSPLTLGGETFGRSGAGYRFRWNGKFIDQSRGAVHRNDSTINYPQDTKSKSRQRLRTTIPSHSHSRGAFINNMGDPRMSYYNQAPQDANIYPQNFSPYRRNTRIASVYSGNNDKIYGRVLPSEWPDGGHDSPFGTDTLYGLLGMTQSAFEDDHRIEPDDPRFNKSLPDLSLGEMEAPMRLSNLGRFYSATELGRVYDPVMWQVRGTSDSLNAPASSWGDVLSSSTPSTDYGGGNTLRIGRPEHPQFDQPGKRASQLLDLFHAGRSRSADMTKREGLLIDIKGQININTASKAALRLLIAGKIQQDPEIRKFLDATHTQGISKYPSYSKLASPPDVTLVADRIASAVIRSRPYASTSELANAKEQDGTKVFGNSRIFPEYNPKSPVLTPALQWTDSAAEETFSKAYEASTVRSRNFRIWVVGQALAPTSPTNLKPEVLAETRRAYTIFADPGARKPDGTIDSTKFKMTILHENDF